MYTWLSDLAVLPTLPTLLQEMNTLLFHYLKLLGFDCYQGMASVVTAGSLKPASKPLEGLVTSKNLGSTVDVMGSHQVGTDMQAMLVHG